MIQFEPYLLLKRLLIESNDGVVVYDETFHEGLNIIRGNNSSGKSTIANFLFYALGGDFKNWTPEAKACRSVYLETEMSHSTLTLRRHISESSQQPMDIYWGSLEASLADPIAGWKNFPYRQSQARESFSTAIFSALGFPEVTTAEESKITMHQVLRLLYIDQDTPTQNLFRFERFDQPITRQTVAELLLGIYDDTLYIDRLSLKFVEQEITQKDQEFNAIKRIFTATGQEIDSDRITKQIGKTEKELTKVQASLADTREKSITARVNSIPVIAKLNEQLGELKKKTSEMYSEIKLLQLDVADSKQFIEALRKKLRGLEESIITHQAFGELLLEFCPVCMNPIQGESDKSRCSLCHQTLPADINKTFGRKLEHEIRQQIRESEKLLKQKEKDLFQKESALKPLVERLNQTQKSIDLHERDHSSTREQKLDEMLIQKGRLESQLEDLARQLSLSQN
jgi:DNA repair exonuclease SbcCD ATPase subunit